MTPSFSVDALVSKYGGRISGETSFKEYGSHRWGYYRTESTQAVTKFRHTLHRDGIALIVLDGPS
jgi:hypothetical protein